MVVSTSCPTFSINIGPSPHRSKVHEQCSSKYSGDLALYPHRRSGFLTSSAMHRSGPSISRAFKSGGIMLSRSSRTCLCDTMSCKRLSFRGLALWRCCQRSLLSRLVSARDLLSLSAARTADLVESVEWGTRGLRLYVPLFTVALAAATHYVSNRLHVCNLVKTHRQSTLESNFGPHFWARNPCLSSPKFGFHYPVHFHDSIHWYAKCFIVSRWTTCLFSGAERP